MSEALEADAKFEAARFYDCRDSESFTHSSPEEAIEEYFNIYFEKGASIFDLIDKHAPLEVCAYEREPVTESWIENAAETLHERLEEDFSEDFGDPDGDYRKRSPEADEEIRRDLLAVVRKAVATSDVWRCEEVAKRTYSYEMLVALLREHCPEWFGCEPDADGERCLTHGDDCENGFPTEEQR